ncbi:MAG: ABC transporter permease [Gammaproteobacteria bacterium]|nr:ABC transporter permease [Gammaproteobacteria bacterium]MDH5310548.1 ABC transporter permease [Gammaproteobacteria bacterium]
MRLGLKQLSPLTRRRLAVFRAHRRGYWSLWIFLGLLVVTLPAEFVANDKPLIVNYQGSYYFPIFRDYPESEFGGFLARTDYRDPFVRDRIEADGWMIWPPLRYSHRTINWDLATPAPSAPTADNWLGTDQQGRDVLAGVIYGFRLSVLFGLTLTALSAVVGVALGAVQGYFGGWVDLSLQRLMEIWGGLPVLYILIIMSSVVDLGFWWLLVIVLAFSWMPLTGLVRAEFLRARKLDYVRAASALGLRDAVIMRRHILPNAMVATLTLLPFTLSASIATLTALDFLGLGLPVGSPSLGELLSQGRANLQAPWLGVTGFVVLATMLSLLIFIGEAVREAFDPRRVAA